MTNTQRSADLKTTSAAMVSMIPGFLVPFVITWSLAPSQSDYLVLALSIMTTLTSAVGAAIELNTVSEFGRNLSDNNMPSRLAMKSYSRRIRLFGFSAVILVGSTLTAVYALSTGAWSPEFIVLCILMLSTPIVSIFSSMNSGILIAGGQAVAPIATQFLRPILAILLLVVWPQIPLLLLPVAFALGELTRWLLLSKIRHNMLAGRDDDQTETLQTMGMIWQSTSAAMSQGAPVVDRVFLAAAPTGSVSMYELTDKVFFAVLQLLNYGFLVRRVGRWSQIPKLPLSQARSLLRSDLTMLLIASAIFSAAGILMLGLASFLPLPALWRASIPWAMVALLAAPLSTWILSASRLIIIARKQRYLLWFSLLTLSANLILNIVFFVLLGAFGIILATVITRLLSALTYAAVLVRIFPGMTARVTTNRE